MEAEDGRKPLLVGRGQGWTWPLPRAVNDLIASHEVVVADLPLFAGTADSSCDS